jgi:hypothetical protein
MCSNRRVRIAKLKRCQACGNTVGSMRLDGDVHEMGTGTQKWVKELSGIQTHEAQDDLPSYNCERSEQDVYMVANMRQKRPWVKYNVKCPDKHVQILKGRAWASG